MELFFSCNYDNILNATIFGDLTDMNYKPVWQKILDRAIAEKRSGLLVINRGKNNISKYHIEKILETISRYPAIVAVAVLRIELPDDSELETLSILKSKTLNTPTPFMFFYDEADALDWLYEIIPSHDL